MASYTVKKITIDGYGTQTESAIRDGNGNKIDETYITEAEKATANGVAQLDANAKIIAAQFPDFILNATLYGGSIDATGVCTLTDAFKTKYAITSLTLSTNASNAYEGAFFIASAAGSITAGSDSIKYPAISYNVGDWIISNGSAGYAKIDNTDAVTGVKGNAETDYRIGNVNITPTNIGLGNVDNTSDANKPISTAQQTALNAKQATLVSGTNIKTIGGVSVLGSGDIDASYTLIAATSATLGGIKIGYTTSGKTYPVELNTNNQAFVSVNWTDTTYDDATTTAHGLMTAAMVVKLNGIDTGATKTIVDTAISSSSTNPVQNKIVYAQLATKQAALTAGDGITLSGTTISTTHVIGTTDVVITY